MNRVLIVGIDGVLLDALDRLPTPALDRVAGAGFLAPVLIDDETPTISGPCWATVATGVTIARHNIFGNDLAGHRLAEHPDFLTVLAGAGRRTYLAADWGPLAIGEDGGPIFARPNRLCYVTAVDHDYDTADERVTVAALHALACDDPEIAFVYLGAVDEIGHLHGLGAQYDEALLRADERLGRLLDVVDEQDDDWTVIVVTDHGRNDDGGHGGTTRRERTAWVAAAGPGIAGSPHEPVRHADVCAQVYASAGFTPPEELVLDGRPFASATISA